MDNAKDHPHKGLINKSISKLRERLIDISGSNPLINNKIRESSVDT